MFVSIIGFIDEYVRDRSRNRLSEAVYIMVANLALPNLAKKKSKILLCSAPPQTPKQELYEIVLVDPLLKLESGINRCFFHPCQREVNLVGTLHCIVADDIASRDATCKLGPTCNNSSRYFDDCWDFSKLRIISPTPTTHFQLYVLVVHT